MAMTEQCHGVTKYYAFHRWRRNEITEKLDHLMIQIQSFDGVAAMG